MQGVSRLEISEADVRLHWSMAGEHYIISL